MDFTVSIITSPYQELVVTRDLELIKLGLLYADSVNVSSPNIYYLLAYAKMATLTGMDRITLLEGMVPHFYDSTKKQKEDFAHLVSLYKAAKHKTQKNYQDIQVIMKVEDYIDQSFEKFLKSADDIISKSGIEPILPLLADGRVKIQDFGSDLNEAPKKLLAGAVASLENDLTYPIFDDQVSKLISAYIKENNPALNFDNSKEMITSKDLFLRLPNVNNLDINQVTKLKTEMELEWYRYKTLVTEYANDIEGTPFDPQVEIKLAKKYEKDFKPQLLELQKSLDKNSFMRHLYDQVLGSVADYSMLCIGTATFSAVKSALVGAAGITIAKGFKAYNDKRNQGEKIKENKIYFYHQLSQLK